MTVASTTPGGAQGIESRTDAQNVLVVDDECEVADTAVDLLRACGFTASAAYSGAQALHVLAVDPTIHVVFSDTMMPEMTGLELADVVNKRHPHIRVVLTSGYAPPTLFNSSGQACAYIAKPYKIEHVIQMIRAE